MKIILTILLITTSSFSYATTFIKAYEVDNSVIYEAKNGDKLIKSGGTKAWRYNNPGNIRQSPLKIGIAHKNGSKFQYAIFTNKDTGVLALVDLLKTKYSHLSISKAMETYEPFNFKNYIAFLVKVYKMNIYKKVGTLNTIEFANLVIGIERFEGWKEGKETFSKGK